MSGVLHITDNKIIFLEKKPGEEKKLNFSSRKIDNMFFDILLDVVVKNNTLTQKCKVALLKCT